MVLDVVWGVVHGIRGACVLCNAQQYGCTLYLKLHLAYTAMSLWGELCRRRQSLCSERECASSHYWLYPVATFEFRLWWLLLKSFRFQGRVETHIIWDAPALVTTSCSGTTCDVCVYWETATFNNNVKWELMTSGSSHDALWDWVWDHWDHDETWCEVETADVAVTSSYPWHSLWAWVHSLMAWLISMALLVEHG